MDTDGPSLPVPAAPSASPASAERPSRRRPLPASVNVVLFVLSVASTVLAGAVQMEDSPLTFAAWRHVLSAPSTWVGGVPYAACILFILGSHEMGHYLACRRYRIDASLPFFVPGPNPFGTFGAVIRIRAPFPDRRALFDVGVAGPLAGMAAAIPVLWYGLAHSRVVDSPPAPGTIVLPSCLLLRLLDPLFFRSTGAGALVLHPVFTAAWLGLFATSLNLLPIGQLDGGHMLYALFPRAHGLASRLAVVALCLVGFTTEAYNLIVFGILFAIVGLRHPRPIDERATLGPGRVAIALLGLAILVLTFFPEAPNVL